MSLRPVLEITASSAQRGPILLPASIGFGRVRLTATWQPDPNPADEWACFFLPGVVFTWVNDPGHFLMKRYALSTGDIGMYMAYQLPSNGPEHLWSLQTDFVVIENNTKIIVCDNDGNIDVFSVTFL